MILRKPPYGDINAAEAVRHALGALSDNHPVSLILLDGGVQIARKNQDETGTGSTNLEAALRDCGEMGVEVLAYNLSLIEYGLTDADIVEGIKAADEADIASRIGQADTTMIF